MENVGQTILQQMKSMNMNDPMCWGAQKFQTFSNGQLIASAHCGGLTFKVNGLLHKGQVVVTLNGKDLYEIRIGKITKGVFVQKGEASTDVFVEDLNETIDNLVEGFYAKGKSVYDNVNLFENV